MKNCFIFILLASLLFFASSGFARSAAAGDRNLIITDGTAELSGRNDSARISIAVITEGK